MYSTGSNCTAVKQDAFKNNELTFPNNEKLTVLIKQAGGCVGGGGLRGNQLPYLYTTDILKTKQNSTLICYVDLFLRNINFENILNVYFY